VKSKTKKLSSDHGVYDITAVWERAKKRLDSMTPEQVQQTFVDSGILTKKGNLTKPYREMLAKAKA
jgi:hypothetical protein